MHTDPIFFHHLLVALPRREVVGVVGIELVPRCRGWIGALLPFVPVQGKRRVAAAAEVEPLYDLLHDVEHHLRIALSIVENIMTLPA